MSYRNRASQFVGRTAEARVVTGFCEHRAPISFLFLLGPAGVGKSRFALESVCARRATGWAAGFYDLNSEELPALDRDTLIVVDYPEENSAGLFGLLKRLMRSEAHGKVRVLCLARVLPPTWDEMSTSAGIGDIYHREPIDLHGIVADAAWSIYHSATETISETLGCIVPPVSREAFGDWYAASPVHSNPLYIVAAAAHSCFEPQDIFLRFEGAQAIEALVRREQDRLRQAAVGQRLDPQAYIDFVTIATVREGVQEHDVALLGDRLPTLRGLSAGDDVLRAISWVDEGRFQIDMPDVVAACFVARALKSSQMASELFWVAMTPELAPITRFARLAADAQIILGDEQSPLITEAIANLTEAERFDQLIRAYGVRQTSELDPVMWPFCEALWARYAESTDDSFLKSGAFNNRARLCTDRGRSCDAVELLVQALDLNAASTHIAASIRESERVIQLLNLGRACIEVGRCDQAIACLQESIALQLKPEARPDSTVTGHELWMRRAPLWLAYDNLARAFSKRGGREHAALTAAQSAVNELQDTRRQVNGPMTWADHNVIVTHAASLARCGEFLRGIGLLQAHEQELRLARRRGGSPDLALLSNVSMQGMIVVSSVYSGYCSVEDFDLTEQEAKANEAVDWAEKLLFAAPNRMCEWVELAHARRAMILDLSGRAEEAEQALAESYKSFSSRLDAISLEVAQRLVVALTCLVQERHGAEAGARLDALGVKNGT